jgi:hypothetical protein
MDLSIKNIIPFVNIYNKLLEELQLKIDNLLKEMYNNYQLQIKKYRSSITECFGCSSCDIICQKLIIWHVETGIQFGYRNLCTTLHLNFCKNCENKYGEETIGWDEEDAIENYKLTLKN